LEDFPLLAPVLLAEGEQEVVFIAGIDPRTTIDIADDPHTLDGAIGQLEVTEFASPSSLRLW
jgi:hypothetical protein